MLVIGASLDPELCWNIEHSSSDSYGDLCADDLPDRGTYIAVSDHEAETYDVDARAEDDGWFVVFGIFDQEGGGYCGDG